MLGHGSLGTVGGWLVSWSLSVDPLSPAHLIQTDSPCPSSAHSLPQSVQFIPIRSNQIYIQSKNSRKGVKRPAVHLGWGWSVGQASVVPGTKTGASALSLQQWCVPRPLCGCVAGAGVSVGTSSQGCPAPRSASPDLHSAVHRPREETAP